MFVEHVAAKGTVPNTSSYFSWNNMFIFMHHYMKLQTSFMLKFETTDGTSLRFLQNILDPLQQLLADGCHLTRETGRYISNAGFSSVDSSTSFISNAVFINPQLYGIAHK